MTTDISTELREEDLAPRPRAPWGRLTLIDDISISDLGYSQYAAIVLERGFTHTWRAWWRTSAPHCEQLLSHALVSHRDRSLHDVVLDLEPIVEAPCVARVAVARQEADVRVAAYDPLVVRAADRWLRRRLPKFRETVRPRAPFSFWTGSGNCARVLTRVLDVHAWSDIRVNYPSTVAQALDPVLAQSYRPGDAGQLLLWHGPPGTGKTNVLRALAWEWREWCDVHFVTDPEAFFAHRSDYMLNVLLRDDDEDDERPRWRLLVLEDAGELVAADAKAQTGQGLSRLLNVVDGVIGQGLRILVLITTNDELRRLHAAVSRPGRCASRVEFRPFAVEEARAWLVARGAAADAERGLTLAELYARVSGRAARELVDARRPSFGFTVPARAE